MSQEDCTTAPTGDNKNSTQSMSEDDCEEMFCLSPQSDFSMKEEEAAADECFDDNEANASCQEDMANKLAFTYDASNLDEEGKPRHKQARKMSRNESEKMRRDRLNAYIAELARLVPLIMSSNRKLDKASVLRLTVTYLRIYHDLIKNGHSEIKWKPDFLTYENLGNLLLESVGGFLLVINQRGILIFATEAFTTTLGHCLVDYLGHSIYKIIHREDQAILQEQFKGFDAGITNDDTTTTDAGSSGHRSFYLRMLLKGNKPERFENFHIVGHLKVVPALHPPHMAPGIQNRGESEVCLVCVARVVSSQPIQELYPIPDTSANQWITRHEMDGKITFSDQRGAWITGFLPGESIGMSAYSLVHPEDIETVVEFHKTFLTSANLPKTVCRIYTKARDVLYIQTNTNMVVDMWTSKPKYIISINEVLSPDEGAILLKAQCDKLRIAKAAEKNPSPSSTGSDSGYEGSEVKNIAPEAGLVIPEMQMGDDGKMWIIVGKDKYTIDTSIGDSALKQPGSASPNQAIFDANVHHDSGGKSIPFIIPKFLGMGENESSSRYDVINSYMGNDPAVIAGTACPPNCVTASADSYPGRPPGGDSYPGRPPGGGISALSGLQAMLNKSPEIGEHSIRQTPANNHQQTAQNWSYADSMGSTHNYGHNGNTSARNCTFPINHAVPTQGIATTTPLLAGGDQTLLERLTSCSTSRLQFDILGTPKPPSTGVKENPELIQLLNRKSVQNTRETVTSHLVSEVNGGTTWEEQGRCKQSTDIDQSSVGTPDKSVLVPPGQADQFDGSSSGMSEPMLVTQPPQPDFGVNGGDIKVNFEPQQVPAESNHLHNPCLPLTQESLQNQMPSLFEDLYDNQDLVQSSSNWPATSDTGSEASPPYQDNFSQLKILKELEERRQAIEGALTALRQEYAHHLQQVNPNHLKSPSTSEPHPGHPQRAPRNGSMLWSHPRVVPDSDCRSPSVGFPSPVNHSTRIRTTSGSYPPFVDDPAAPQHPETHPQAVPHSGFHRRPTNDLYPARMEEDPGADTNYNLESPQASTSGCAQLSRNRPSVELCQDFDVFSLNYNGLESLGQGEEVSYPSSVYPSNIADPLGPDMLCHNGETSSQQQPAMSSSPHQQAQSMHASHNPFKTVASPIHQDVTSSSDAIDYAALGSDSQPSPDAIPKTTVQKVLLQLLKQKYQLDGGAAGNGAGSSSPLVSAIMSDEVLVQDLLEQYVSKSAVRSDNNQNGDSH